MTAFPTNGQGSWGTQLGNYISEQDALRKPFMTTTAVKTANYTAAAGELVRVDISGGSFTVTLPSAATKWEVFVKVVAASTTLASTTCTVAAAGTDTINIGLASVPLRYSNQAKVFASDGAGGITVTTGDFDKTVNDTLYTARGRGLDLWVYGDSGALVPGFRCTPGREWPTLLARQLGGATMRTYAVGGSDATNTAGHMMGGTPASGQGYAAVSGSAWDGTRRGIVVLHLGLNDYAGYTDRTTSPIVPVATNTAHQNGMVNAFRTCLAIASSASRVEFSTFSGTWSTYTSADQSGGTSRFSSINGNFAEATVTFPSTGKVHAILSAFPDAGSNVAAACTVAVDGVTQKTYTSADLTMRRVKFAATPTFNAGSAVAVPLTGTAGSHTIRVTHTGTGGQFVSVDTVLVPSTTPPPIFIPQEWTPTANVNQWSSTDITTLAANRAVLEPLYQAVVAEFSNAYWTTLPSMTAGGLSDYDSLHQNDRGMQQETYDLYRAISAYLNTNDPSNLYVNLSAQTPTPNTTLLESGTWGTASTVSRRMPYRTLVTISGGTVTASGIDGQNTGLTSGAFVVPAGHTFFVTYSVAPTYCMFDVT